MSLRFFQILNILGFLFVITMNTLANTLPINGKTTGELSDLYPNLFVPAGFTFSIWGIIYLLLLGFTVFQIRDWWQRPKPEMAFLQKTGPWFFLSCLANGGWIVAWHYEQVLLSFATMLFLLVSLIVIYQRLGIGKEPAPKGERLWVHLPFRIYPGWITVATIANATAVLVDAGWNGWGISEIIWTVVMISIATLFGILFIVQRRDLFYGLVILWAFLGIYVKRISDNSIDPTPVIVTLLIGSILIFLFIGIRLFSFEKNQD